MAIPVASSLLAPAAFSLGAAPEQPRRAEASLPPLAKASPPSPYFAAASGVDGLSQLFARSAAGLFSDRARREGYARVLSPETIDELSAAEVAESARGLVDAAKRGGTSISEALEAALPPDDLSALLASERDLDDFDAAAQKDGPSGDRYAEISALAPSLMQERRRYEILFSTVYDELSRYVPLPEDDHPEELGPIAGRGEIAKPSLSSLRNTHPYALDVFFTDFDEGPAGSEIGPEIKSLSAGIVIGAAGDWKGGAGAKSYRSGGLSPNSGNGVVVYDPVSRRYYSYFHLSETALETGDLVQKGTIIGKGGNTGANARKPGHGGHVHVEIFDASEGRPLSSREIRSLIF